MSFFSKRKVALSKNAALVLRRRYLKRNGKGKLRETPNQMFERVARNVASAEARYGSPRRVQKTAQAFFEAMTNLEFLPNSPTLMNAGNKLQQLSACFVLPIDDSLESIFETVKHTALIHQSGGGTGFSFSRIRPRNDRVLTTSGIASGPVSFMKVFNLTTEVIKQGGTRRGANMGVLRVDHPDILEFVTVKENPREFTNFNLSVGITDSFMKALKTNGPFSLVNPRTGKRIRRVSSQFLFDQIVEQAWKTGDPGLLFLDRINAAQPTPRLGTIEATNPCGEQPLLPYEACTLGSINLARMIKKERGRVVVDYSKLDRAAGLAVRFLDDVLDINHYPVEAIRKMSLGNRKIGVGVMGFADLLVQLGVPYDSPEALDAAVDVMGFVEEKTREASIQLGRERGVFPNFKTSRLNRRGSPRMRNATTTTVAPTGTLSIIAGCSSGIEPLYGVAYTRLAMGDTRLTEINPYFHRIAKRMGFLTPDVLNRIQKTGSLRGVAEIPRSIQKLFATSQDISPEFHVKIQAAFQRYTDNAVSKTVNFPNQATQKDVAKVFRMAYEEGCKGITVYRSGSRDRQILSCSNALYC